MISLFVILFTALVLSAFFSAAEMAFISSNKAKLRELADRGNREARIVMDFAQNPHRFLTTILIGNNIANVIFTSALTYFFTRYLKINNEWVIVAFTAPILIIVAEIVPKEYGRSLTHSFLLRATYFLKILSTVFYYPTLFFIKLVDFIFNPIAKSWHKSIFVNEREFRSLIEESVKAGVVTSHEKKMIDTILDFEKVRVESVMLPTDRVAKVEISARLGDAKKEARAHQAEMLLVYEEDPSLVVGMIYTFDFLFVEDPQTPLKSFLRSPIFLSHSTSVEKAFIEMKDKRQSYAVVTDDHGEVIGAVQIEKLFQFER